MRLTEEEEEEKKGRDNIYYSCYLTNTCKNVKNRNPASQNPTQTSPPLWIKQDLYK